jgi:hypothetical protein
MAVLKRCTQAQVRHDMTSKSAGTGLNCSWKINGLTVRANGLNTHFDYKRTNPQDGVIRIFTASSLEDPLQEVPADLILDPATADCSGTQPAPWDLDQLIGSGYLVRVELWQKQPLQRQDCVDATVQ